MIVHIDKCQNIARTLKRSNLVLRNSGPLSDWIILGNPTSQNSLNSSCPTALPETCCMGLRNRNREHMSTITSTSPKQNLKDMIRIQIQYDGENARCVGNAIPSSSSPRRKRSTFVPSLRATKPACEPM